MPLRDVPEGPIRILVSACLLGEKVRYDGGHKRDPFLVETLGRFVEYIPVCPEVECGLPVPRESMRLAGDAADPRLIAPKSGTDHTARMKQWAREKLRQLEDLDLCGYICKKDSPSSGMERVKVYRDDGTPAKVGVGLFTKAFMDRFPLIPVEEEGRLQDPVLRELFVERVFTLRRLRDSIRRGKSRGNLVSFHTDHKMLILTHGRTGYSAMGKLVAQAREHAVDDLYERYLPLLMESLALRPTPAKCADVLMHMMGHLRPFLTPDEKQELLELIGRYRNRLMPLIVPVTLLRHYVRKYNVAYLERQTFLQPHPVELMLRNHV
ncbi:MAG: YbgA family protein [Verrucomicrobiota bacterium]